MFADMGPGGPVEIAGCVACGAVPFVIGFVVLITLHIRRTRARDNTEKPYDDA
jgi:hypothetical protein